MSTYDPASKLFFIFVSSFLSPDSPKSPNKVMRTSASVPAWRLVPVNTVILYLFTASCTSSTHLLLFRGYYTAVFISAHISSSSVDNCPRRSRGSWHIRLSLFLFFWTLLLLLLLARDSIHAIARYMPSPVRLSFHPSHRWISQKTAEVRNMQPSPQSSPMTLVSWRLTSPWNSKGKIGSGGTK